MKLCDRKSGWPFIVVVICSGLVSSALPAAEISFSTFLGGSEWEHARDVCVDDSGNVYVVGGTRSSDFPTTENALQTVHEKSGDKIGSGGYCDVFVSKFDASGTLIWSTLLGGPNYDRAYAVEVDAAGNVYVAGRAGPGFPVTKDAFQPDFQGDDGGIYGLQNGFVAKINPEGTAVVWASYVGVGLLCRDIAVDDDGDVYLPTSYPGNGAMPPKSWFEGAFQPTPGGGADCGALKVTTDGRHVVWATWLGGSQLEVPNAGIRIDSQKNVYINMTTESADLPTTPGAHDRSHNGGKDAYIAKLSPDGKHLLYGTYFGSAGNEFGNSTHSMAIDQNGNAYLVNSSDNDEMPATTGVVQPHLKGERNIVVTKFSPEGALLHCTYLGGSNIDGVDGVYANDQGEVYFTGTTSSADFPMTPDALQGKKSGDNDVIVVSLKSDFSGLKFASYLGGPSYDYGRSSFLDKHGSFYLVGSTNGEGWPTVQAVQESFAGGGGGKELCYQGGCHAGDVIVMKITF
ncbi:Beta-propeller repeat protein [Thalassoglobus neptunius]|uniref:Beta-propeller repeat protein n=1 Tax=Thalassoglobus neptunius TaxID=1938619 RepID=A0A5C5VPJ5_9PLAN|nr:SBBP repeat-containing protein [Thalassoglobus neptunius]TWT39855.1 Beta-propeller repeat protein [Thalassoglobus neptunius]